MPDDFVQNNHFINLDNYYDFKAHCHRSSIRAFDSALEEQHYPSRFNLLFLAACEVPAAPVPLIRKIVEIALYFWNLSHQKDPQGFSFHVDYLPSLVGWVSFQLTMPLLCTAIRMGAAVSGLLDPKHALRGWKLAEAGEELTYQLWSEQHGTLSDDLGQTKVCKEIHPQSAVFYLGLNETQHLLREDPSVIQNIEEEITANFLDLLSYIANANPLCFKKLFDYDTVIKSPKLTKKGNSYHLDGETEQHLFGLRNLRPCSIAAMEKFSDKEEEEKAWQREATLIISDIFRQLPIEKIRVLFLHVYMNLQDASLCSELHLDPQQMQNDLTHLEDLMSRRFSFGRAHFYRSNCHLPHLHF